MTSSSTLLRTLVTYALILPLALILGYALATPMDPTTWAMVAMVLLLVSLPILLRFHRPMLFLFWNTTTVVFFLPGRPQVWILMSFISLGIIISQKALIRDFQFLHIRPLLAPIAFIALVVVGTGYLRGGFGLASMGDSIGGGRRYFTMLAGMAGFLAMTAARIPPQRAWQYLGLFFLGALMNAVGALVNLVSPGFYWVFLFFPVDALPGQAAEGSIWRAWGLTLACFGVFLFLLARYGTKNLLFSGNLMRLLLVSGIVLLTMTGGYRTFFVLAAMTAFFLAYIEGLFTSRYAIVLWLTGILGIALLVPIASRLPLSVQRTLSVIPVLEVSPEAAENARRSNEWRLKMWETLLPDVPKYFFLGKGLAVDVRDLVFARDVTSRDVNRADESAKVAGDFHNGPLTVLINFGVWGAIGWIWLLIASGRALHRNWRYGDESLKQANALLLAYFHARVVLFFLVFGSFHSDLAIFLGIVGLSVALNGGILSRAGLALGSRQAKRLSGVTAGTRSF